MFRTCLFATNKDVKVKNIVFGLKNEDLMKEWFINLKQAIVIYFFFSFKLKYDFIIFQFI